LIYFTINKNQHNLFKAHAYSDKESVNDKHLENTDCRSMVDQNFEVIWPPESELSTENVVLQNSPVLMAGCNYAEHEVCTVPTTNLYDKHTSSFY